MNNEEVNRVIAEFMGTDGKGLIATRKGVGEYSISNPLDIYTRSLDALVPVWEKLDTGYRFI